MSEATNDDGMHTMRQWIEILNTILSEATNDNGMHTMRQWIEILNTILNRNFKYNFERSDQ